MKRQLLLTGLFIFLVSPILVTGNDNITIIAEPFENTSLNLSDDAIDPSWDLIQYFVMPEELGSNAMVKFSNNGTHLFSLLKVDSQKDWIALEFGAYEEFCMVDGNDGWTIYIDQETNTVEIFDELYTGAVGAPDHDQVNHLSFESIVEDNFHFIEIVRLMDTEDNQDLSFSDGDLWNVKFASSTHHAKGGLDNPTEFGPSIIYYISVQTGSEVEVPIVPTRVDYDFYKLVIFAGIFLSTAIFVCLHCTIRQVVRPLSHPSQIVDNTYKPPTLSSRWNELMGDDQPKGQTKTTHSEAKA